MSNIKLSGNPSGSGSLTIAAPNTNSDFTLNLPASAGTIPVLGSVTNNGVVYVNSSGQATSGSGLVFDASGNMGLGVTPSAWGSPFRAFQFGPNGGSINARTDANQAVEFALNWYYDGSTSRYINSNPATRYRQFNGAHEWYTAPSGTAGNAVTFTQAMTLDASGRLGVGVTTVDARFQAKGSTGAQIMVDFGNNSNTNYYDADTHIFRSYGSGGYPERARIDSSGNLLVGTTTATGGGILTNSPQGWGIARYLTDQSGRRNWAVATESLNAGDICLVASTANNTAPNTVRFQVRSDGSTFNSTGTYGTISDVKLKENIIDTAPKLADLLQVRVVNYNRIGEQRKELGVIAQELEQIFPGMIDEQEDLVDGKPTGTTTKAVKYSVFVPMLIKAIQEQQALITQLTARIEALEAK